MYKIKVKSGHKEIELEIPNDTIITLIHKDGAGTGADSIKMIREIVQELNNIT